VLAGGVGAMMDVTDQMFVNLGVGYQMGFQKATVLGMSGDEKTKFLRNCARRWDQALDRTTIIQAKSPAPFGVAGFFFMRRITAMRKLAPALSLAALAFTSTAHAQGGGYPDAYALRPLQLPTGMVQLKVPVIINLSKGSVASPVFIPFELRLGLTSDLELRIFHPVHGLCVSGHAKGCDRVYNDLALGMLYSVMRERA